MSKEKPPATYVLLHHGVPLKHKLFETSSEKLNYIVNVIRYLEKDMDRSVDHSPYTIGVK
tara:strand:- start:16883 stop:17062 length:180 start_codon:yes stop_codon:yes gene_type:complete